MHTRHLHEHAPLTWAPAGWGESTLGDMGASRVGVDRPQEFENYDIMCFSRKKIPESYRSHASGVRYHYT